MSTRPASARSAAAGAAILLAGVLAAGSASAGQAECRAAWDAVQAGALHDDPDAVLATWKQADPPAVCSSTSVLTRLAADAAMAHVRAARQGLAAGWPPERALDVLVAAQAYGTRPWDLDVLEADLSHKLKKYPRSAILYQWLLLTAEERGPKTLSKADLSFYRMRAIEARQLAEEFVPAQRSPDGRLSAIYGRMTVEPAGTGSGGATSVAAVPAPVRFAYNSDRLTEADAAVAAELCEYLRELPADRGRIRLTGHTDDVGSDPFNDDLSRRRAGAVAAYLRDRQCWTGPIEVSGRGKREPLRLSDPALYPSQDERNRLNRRVEMAVMP